MAEQIAEKAAGSQIEQTAEKVTDNNENDKEDNKMKETLKIEGMMCEHCKKHVEEALNAMEGVKFYQVPNLDAIKSRGLGAVVFDAMTHAFFTLSVGIGAMEIFGSYQKREHSIPGEAANIVILDTFVALMAGFIIIPACFAYGVQPDAGPDRKSVV